MRPLVFALLAVATTALQQDPARRERYERINWPGETVQVTLRWEDKDAAETVPFKMTVPKGWRTTEDREVSEGMLLGGEGFPTSVKGLRFRAILRTPRQREYVIGFEKGEEPAKAMDIYRPYAGMSIVVMEGHSEDRAPITSYLAVIPIKGGTVRIMTDTNLLPADGYQFEELARLAKGVWLLNRRPANRRLG